MKNLCPVKAKCLIFVLFSFLVSALAVSAQNMFRKVSDFDGDGKADFAVTRNTGGFKNWWILQSTGGVKVVQFGLPTDQNIGGDYDGDGKADIAVFRDTSSFPPQYTFYFLESATNTFNYKVFTAFANFGSRIAHQDYNGDGKTDAAINLGEFGLITNLNVLYSGAGNAGFSTQIPAGEVPFRIGDTDGDGRAEKAHYKLSNNLVTITNLATNATQSLAFGQSGDQYQMADFDGDGKGDLTVWRQTSGVWWWIRSSDNTIRAAQWGANGDTPVPADYDGDGKTDLAIWRSGVYWILGSQNGVNVVSWGTSTDTAVQF